MAARALRMSLMSVVKIVPETRNKLMLLDHLGQGNLVSMIMLLLL